MKLMPRMPSEVRFLGHLRTRARSVVFLLRHFQHRSLLLSVLSRRKDTKLGRFVSSLLHQTKIAPSLDQNERNFFFSWQVTWRGLGEGRPVGVTEVAWPPGSVCRPKLWWAVRRSTCPLHTSGTLESSDSLSLTSVLPVTGFLSWAIPKHSAPTPGTSPCPHHDEGQRAHLREQGRGTGQTKGNHTQDHTRALRGWHYVGRFKWVVVTQSLEFGRLDSLGPANHNLDNINTAMCTKSFHILVILGVFYLKS